MDMVNLSSLPFIVLFTSVICIFYSFYMYHIGLAIYMTACCLIGINRSLLNTMIFIK